MGLMDRDYWRDRYNRRTNRGVDLNEVRKADADVISRVVLRSRSRSQQPSFMFKLLVSFAVAFICVLAYRYLR